MAFRTSFQLKDPAVSLQPLMQPSRRNPERTRSACRKERRQSRTAIREQGGTPVASYGYDNQGRRTVRSLKNGNSSVYGYDGISRLTGLTLNMGGTAGDQTYGYSYSPASQVFTRNTTNASYSYAPSAISFTYQNNGLNQPTNVSDLTLNWSAQGNPFNFKVKPISSESADLWVS